LPKPPPDAWAEVTLRQLLNHTSGLPDYTGDPDYQEAFLASLTKAPPAEKLLTYVYDHDPPLLFDPGSKYQYSNSDNIAVALMVEAATGTSYEDQLREQFYRPLGLRKTTLPRGPNLRKPFIHGYDNDPSQQTPEDLSEDFAAGWAWASGGMVSTPADLNDFIRGYVGGELFDKRTRAKHRDGSWKEEAQSLLARGRTRQVWPSSATRRSAGRCGATRATSSATLSSWRPVPTGGAR